MFQPAIPFDGLAGWRMLQRTYDTQFDAFSKSPLIKRDTEYFRENIAKVETASDLVSDRRMLTVALGAFGLQDDLNNRYFVQKILEEGTVDDDALANRFSDPRYAEFSKAFGFGATEIQRNKLSDFPDAIIDAYERQEFEVAVGEQSQTLRIALTAERTFADIAEAGSSERANWFKIMSQPPMRDMFQTVFNLPQSFSQADIDQQQAVLADRSQRMFGTSDPADFADPELLETLTTRFTAMSSLQNSQGGTSSGSLALTLLRGF